LSERANYTSIFRKEKERHLNIVDVDVDDPSSVEAFVR
jgi:hypothetical protein